MTGLGYLTGQTAIPAPAAEPKRCSDCGRLWREYQHAARTYASMMQAQCVFADEPDEMPAVIAAIRSAAETWSQARTKLLRHDRIHQPDGEHPRLLALAGL
jgi:hypothetical protein